MGGAMSVYQVMQWSVNDADSDACEQALVGLAEHVRTVHPTAKSLRIYRQVWGSRPWRAYLCHIEYESLTAMDADPDTPACDKVWAPIFAAALPGTFATSVWSDRQRSVWFER